MTPPYEQNPGSTDKRLEDILRTVRSIDGNVEEILGALHDHFNDDKYDPAWTNHDYAADQDD